jgi:hypothetical protein
MRALDCWLCGGGLFFANILLVAGLLLASSSAAMDSRKLARLTHHCFAKSLKRASKGCAE